jgi:hypothetical protein
MTHMCKKCGQAKAAADMFTRQGKILATCKACYAAAVAAGRALPRATARGGIA